MRNFSSGRYIFSRWSFLLFSFIGRLVPGVSSFSSSLFQNNIMSVDVSSSTTGALDGDLASRISYRPPTAQEIPACFAIESASYPPDEAATLEGLNYRLANASDYFQCAILDETTIIGFVCSTRCEEFEEESMSTHVDTGSLLAIHSVVVQEEYRRKGIATAMLKAYLETVQNENVDGSIQSFVLLAKSHLLGFYVNCGFRVNRPSPIVHGQELWYELEKPLLANNSPRDDESWFCKTEEFKRPFPEVKPHLENHKLWVNSLRREGKCITSGYRVDSEGKPGGGGLMFLAARSYEEAFQIVKQDPLVANDCVEWELNGWIGQVGDLQMK